MQAQKQSIVLQQGQQHGTLHNNRLQTKQGVALKMKEVSWCTSPHPWDRDYFQETVWKFCYFFRCCSISPVGVVVGVNVR